MSNYNTQPEPSADMKALERLVGTWKVSGGTEGTVRYEWMEGKFFLMQYVEMSSSDNVIKGVEIIGHVQASFDAPPSEDIKSRYYDNMGSTFDYVYELDGDTLTIWGGEKGSPAYYRGMFSADGNTLSGAWTYPGGGGYESTSTRMTA